MSKYRASKYPVSNDIDLKGINSNLNSRISLHSEIDRLSILI